jgi:hypothetical protein
LSAAGRGRRAGLSGNGDLRKLASIKAGSAHADGDRWDALGVTLMPRASRSTAAALSPAPYSLRKVWTRTNHAPPELRRSQR